MQLVELSHWWFRGRRSLLQKLVREIARRRTGSLRILDYGSGTGGNTQTYGSFGWVVGIEPDGFAVRVAQDRGGASYCRADGIQLPFRAGAFDVAVASDVLEHIADDSAAVSELIRVVRPGGSIVVTVPAHQWLFSTHDTALHHFRRYSKAALRSVLSKGGLRLRRLSYWNATLFPLVCVHRLLQRRSAEPPRSDARPAPRIINEVLAGLLTGEAELLRHVALPWGLSLVAVAEVCGERAAQRSSSRSEESARSGVAAD